MEDFGHVCCVLNEILCNDVTVEVWQMSPAMGTTND